ncbi:MAG TPA: kelch repeat-containing protein [Chloroflexota bacterium]|nr:kelch repeat-containing protein [Chloroflexota bacterium]
MWTRGRGSRLGPALVALGGVPPGLVLPPVLTAQVGGNTWAPRTPMLTGRAGLGVATATNGKLYAIGGYDGTNFLATVEEYDPSSNTWTNCGGSPTANHCSAMPTARSDLKVAAAANGKLYAIGGGNASGTLTTVEQYDPSTNTWTEGVDAYRSCVSGAGRGLRWEAVRHRG